MNSHSLGLGKRGRFQMMWAVVTTISSVYLRPALFKLTVITLMSFSKALLNVQHPSLKWGLFQKILYVEPTLCNLQLHEEVWGAEQVTAASASYRERSWLKQAFCSLVQCRAPTTSGIRSLTSPACMVLWGRHEKAEEEKRVMRQREKGTQRNPGLASAHLNFNFGTFS